MAVGLLSAAASASAGAARAAEDERRGEVRVFLPGASLLFLLCLIVEHYTGLHTHSARMYSTCHQGTHLAFACCPFMRAAPECCAQ
jgi:hypothetical protein